MRKSTIKRLAILIALMVLPSIRASANSQTVSAKSDDNAKLTLSDGSVFSVDQGYRDTVSSWHVGDTVSYDNNSGGCANEYRITNKNDKQKVCVTISDQAPKQGHGKEVSVQQHTGPRVFIASNHAWSSTASVTAASHSEGTTTVTGHTNAFGNVTATGSTEGTSVGRATEHANGVEYSTLPKLAAELTKDCPGVIVTSDVRRADYVVEFGGSRVGEVAPLYGILRHNASVAVFLPDGDSVLARSDHTLQGAMQDVCRAIGMTPEK